MLSRVTAKNVGDVIFETHCSWQRQWVISVYGVKICEQVLTTDEYATYYNPSYSSRDCPYRYRCYLQLP